MSSPDPQSAHSQAVESRSERQAVIENAFQKAVICDEAGHLREAESLYRAILEAEPLHPESNYRLGTLLQHSGQTEEALGYFSRACETEPETGRHWLAAADCLVRLLRFDEAAGLLEIAIEAGLDDPRAASLLEQAKAAGRATAANSSEALIGELKSLAARQARSGYGGGKSRNRPDPLQRALERYLARDWPGLEAVTRKDLRRAPEAGKLWDFLGIAYLQMEKAEPAKIALTRASELLPGEAEVWDHLGVAERLCRRYAEAEACFERSLAIEPARTDTLMNIGNLRVDQQRLDEAVACFQRILEADPNQCGALCNLGNALKQMNRDGESIAYYRRALELDPTLAEVHNNLGNALKAQGQLKEAVAAFQNAISLQPAKGKFHFALGWALYHLRSFDAAIASFRRAIQLEPQDSHGAFSVMLYALSHDEATSPEEEFAEFHAYGERYEAPLRPAWPAHRNDRDPARRLRVGFVSADLRNHAVATFIEPVWAALDQEQVEIWAYSNSATVDEITCRLKALARVWQQVDALSDQDLADRILADQIDILVDLSGHTAGHRLMTFARKPAPVQASWIGFPNTTGLTAMDYYLADRFMAPAGLLDSLFTEKLVRLPSVPCFEPYAKAPPVSALPALERGYVTFGSFNGTRKIGSSVIQLWSGVLNAVPGSRLMLAGIGESRVAEELRLKGTAQFKVSDDLSSELIAQFAQYGISADRLSFFPRTIMDVYLAMHSQVDLILDTFPYTGGTTTFHANWMGVPVLTLAGRTLPSRQGVALNNYLGLEGFVANSPDDFVARAVDWSGRLAELAELRANLRGRVEASPLRRPEIVAQGLQSAFRTMWQRWCDGLPAESFEVKL